MRIDFATLAFGYVVKTGGNTPNWATALGQGKDHKINNTPQINEMLQGLIYSAVAPDSISTKIGKGGKIYTGNERNTPIVIGAVFDDVYINETPIIDGKFIIIITRDTSSSHAGRLRIKYGPSNTYSIDGEEYTNHGFFDQVKKQLKLADDACWFVSDISVINQNQLVLKTTIVDATGPVEYANTKALHAAWEDLDSSVIDSISTESDGGENVLYYGVPGSGKSHIIDELIVGADYERVVFHPDYSYADFIGQIMPRVKKLETGDEKLSYEFVPGPFTKAMKAALENPEEMFFLIIEEINRGNAPAIFGDVFQLLDRESDGSGKFHITNYDIARELFGVGNEDAQIKMPKNLSVYATMNTSDQNVFTLDTAFQRRWNMKYVPNNVSAAKHADKYLDDRQEVTWSEFAEFVNKIILDYNSGIASSEDKQLGAYFIKENELNKEQFAEKVLKYLWDDVYKLDRDEFFNPDIKSIGDMVESYIKAEKQPLKRVMRAEVYKRLMDNAASSPEEAYDNSEIFETKPADVE